MMVDDLMKRLDEQMLRGCSGTLTGEERLHSLLVDVKAEISRLREVLDEAEKALEPFALWHNDPRDRPSIGDCERAVAALAKIRSREMTDDLVKRLLSRDPIGRKRNSDGEDAIAMLDLQRDEIPRLNARIAELEKSLNNAILELRAKDPNFTPIFDSYANENQRLSDEAEALRAGRNALAAQVRTLREALCAAQRTLTEYQKQSVTHDFVGDIHLPKVNSVISAALDATASIPAGHDWRAEAEKLAGALKPFSAAASSIEEDFPNTKDAGLVGPSMDMGDLRFARTALADFERAKGTNND